jgi:MinD-like ATPase involved in chromosome partitioning or flagellar assembly
MLGGLGEGRGSAPGSPDARPVLVTVVSPVGRFDLALPSDQALEEILPDIVRAAAGPDEVSRWARWELRAPEGMPLDTARCLQEQGLGDGAVLCLARRAAEAETSADLPPVGPEGPLLAPAEWPPGSTRPARATPAPATAGAASGPVAAPPGAAPAPTATGDGVPPVLLERTLLDRTRALLPPRHGALRRLAAATGAALRRPSPDSRPPAIAGPAPSPASLTVAKSPSALARARAAWRATDYLEELDAAIAAPRLRRCVTIAVVSPKGGVGKTTITSLLGTLLALQRRDRIVAVDTNPDFGSLGRVLTPDHQLFVDDLLARVGEPELTLTDLDTQLGRAVHGLMVLPAPTDPARMARLDEEAYRSVIDRLKGFVGMVILDCGTGLQEPAARAALATCDQILLVTDAEPATASLVAEAGTLVAASGRPIIVVVNKLPAARVDLDLGRLGAYLPQASAMLTLPSQPEAAGRLSGGSFDWRDAPEPWQRACRELAVVITSAWPELGVTL